MAVGLCQFYTRPHVAVWCFGVFGEVAREVYGEDAFGRVRFVEPSAGMGDFLDLMPKDRRIGCDVDSPRADVKQWDFLATAPEVFGAASGNVVVGNPPFGVRGGLALRFLNHAAQVADTVAFVLPACFAKYLTQKRVDAGLRLVCSRVLPADGFYTRRGAGYRVNTVFQVWTRRSGGGEDLRRLAPPPIAHEEFTMWQYNNTRQALKVFARDFLFGVPCQGWQDYGRRERRVCDMEKNKQWLLLRPHGAAAYAVLHDGIDYEALARAGGTCTPGFRKHDVVEMYVRCRRA